MERDPLHPSSSSSTAKQVLGRFHVFLSFSAKGCGSLSRIQGLSPSCIANFDEINLYSCPELVNQGIHMAHVLPLEVACKLKPDAKIAFNGTELPDWLQQSNFPDSVSFFIPSNMADNLVGIISCGVFDNQNGSEEGLYNCIIETFINDESVHFFVDNSFWGEQLSGVVYLRALNRYHSIGASRLDEMLMRHDPGHFIVTIVFKTTEGGAVRKCGFRLIFKGEEDELQAIQLLERIDPWGDEGHGHSDP